MIIQYVYNTREYFTLRKLYLSEFFFEFFLFGNFFWRVIVGIFLGGDFSQIWLPIRNESIKFLEPCYIWLHARPYGLNLPC